MKKWQLLHESEETDVAKIISILLGNRGIADQERVKEFLNPSFDSLILENTDIDQSELKTAGRIIKKAISQKDSIVVYTDYDVDGLCGGAIVWECLYNLGAKVMPYVPDRVEEGYGLSKKGIDTICEKYKVKLLITVDHGVTAASKIEYARSLGIETIILDHHLLPKDLPKVSSLIHTTKMCAGGISFFFAHYLYSFFNRKISKNTFLDLAALATVADLVPLTGLNRNLVKYGLLELNKRGRVGLKALVEASCLNKPNLEVYDISFILAPRINAIGRLAHAIDALRLLCTKDADRAIKLSKCLCDFNRERQVLTKDSTLQAIEMVRKESFTKLLFISNKDFQEGVLGLIAGKLVDEFYRPAIVVSVGPEISKASARSIAGFNIVEAIRSASDLVIDVGGHPMAAGFTVKTANLEALKIRLLEHAALNLKDNNFIKAVKIDLPLKTENINFDFFEEISKFSPFGMGNPEPVFLTRNLEVAGVRFLGKEKKHIKITMTGRGESGQNVILSGIGFNMGDLFHKINPKQGIDVVYSIDKDDWGGRGCLQLKIKDVNLC